MRATIAAAVALSTVAATNACTAAAPTPAPSSASADAPVAPAATAAADGFVTSEGTASMREQAREAGALFLVGKPFTVEAFQMALRPWLA